MGRLTWDLGDMLLAPTLLVLGLCTRLRACAVHEDEERGSGYARDAVDGVCSELAARSVCDPLGWLCECVRVEGKTKVSGRRSGEDVYTGRSELGISGTAFGAVRELRYPHIMRFDQ